MTGSLTLRLKDIPWDQALDIIMQTKGLDMRKNGNVVLIAHRARSLPSRRSSSSKPSKQISDLEPLVTESFQLNYIKAQDLVNLISSNRQQAYGAGAGQTATTGGQGSIISKRGVAIVDPRSNILFVSDTASRLEDERRIIRQIDTPARQVVIESRIVVADDKFSSRQLGVRFGVQTGFTLNKRYAGGIGGSLASQPVVTTQRHDADARHSHADALRACIGHCHRGLFRCASAQRQPAGSQPGRTGRADADSILAAATLINLELSALEADSRGKVVSSPRVVTPPTTRRRASSRVQRFPT